MNLSELSKNKIKKIILYFAVCVLTFIPMAVSDMTRISSADAETADLQKQINDKRASITANANMRKEIENKIASLKNQKADAIREKQLYDDLISKIEDGIRETEELIGKYEEFITEKEIKIAEKQAEYEKSFDLFLKMIKISYEEGESDFLGLLLKSKNLTEFLSRADIVANLIECNKSVINDLLKSKEDLEDAKNYNEDALSQQKEYSKLLESSSRDVADLIKKAETSITLVSSEINQNIARQAEYEKMREEMQKEIATLSKELQARQESQRKYVGGTFLWPVPVEYYKISSGFGPRKSPITGRQEHHDGIDIPAPRNTSVYAANDGTVIVVKYSQGYGYYTVVDHGGGKTTLYAHHTVNLKKAGDVVKRGDVIARVGTTGWSTGNHLHFGYYENGVPKNPLLNGLSQP